MTSHEVSGIWNALGQMYGSRFYEQYGTKANEAWGAALTALDRAAALYAVRALVKDGSDFPPTLPKFAALAGEFRPRESVMALPDQDSTGVENMNTSELRAAASSEVAAFESYRDYERWRDAHTVKGKRPPHPTPMSADWSYLNRLAWIQAASDMRRTRTSLNP